MTFVRRNVWNLGSDWAEPILWYARGVAAMQKRTLAEPTSWLFYGAIHGFNQRLWTRLGYFQPGDNEPDGQLIRQFWAQCQHGSWYFLPWHRGYLLAFEQTVRVAVHELGGPADWALPYWNYFKPDQSALPPAFASPDWPDGVGDNPLHLRHRYGPNGDGNVFVPLDQVDLKAMGDPEFTGVSDGGSPGYGGIDTGFSHGGNQHGGIETQPHDWVHGLVGGYQNDDPRRPGAMSVPDSAALDPIFWLHHANIDRLWASWNKTVASHLDPADPKWLDGPASVGERAFAMPMPDGKTWTYTPRDMTDLQPLGYEYDDLDAGVTPVSRHHRLARLGLAAGGAEGLAAGGAEGRAAGGAEGLIGGERVDGQPSEEEPAVPAGSNVELVGANTQSVSIRGSGVHSDVQLDPGMRRKVASSLAAPLGARAAVESANPDRVFLNLQNVRGQSDAAAFRVYVGVPEGENPADHPERLAGSIAPFGLSKASTPDAEHAGQGLTYVLEITDIVDQMHLANSFDVDRMPVRIVPVRPLPDDAAITVGRISIYRQGS